MSLLQLLHRVEFSMRSTFTTDFNISLYKWPRQIDRPHNFAIAHSQQLTFYDPFSSSDVELEGRRYRKSIRYV